MQPSAMVLMGLLSFLFGCAPKGAYHKKDGSWYHKSQPLGGVTGNLTILNDNFARAGSDIYYQSFRLDQADGPSFVALSDHYAKDQSRVFYCATYRDGRDYFTTKRFRTPILDGADPGTFRYLDRGYARDTSDMFFEGKRFPVRDIATFELLEYSFARDRASGYYMREAVPGSDGSTFTGLDSHYAKDRTSVFYADLQPGEDGTSSMVLTVKLSGAQPESFAPLDSGYGADASHVYYRGKVMPGVDPATFKIPETAPPPVT